MEEAQLARLRVQREQNTEQRYAEGVKAGKDWALNRATYDQLEAVADLFDSHDARIGEFDLALAYFNGDELQARADMSDLMEALFGRPNPGEACIRGFVAGATEVFDKV